MQQPEPDGIGATAQQAPAIAASFLGSNRVIQVFGKYRTYLRENLLAQDPSLLEILQKWGYGTPTHGEVGAGLYPDQFQQQQQQQGQ